MVFNVTDDDVAGEPIQTYNLTLSEEPDTVTVSQRTVKINIIDDDRKSNDRQFVCVNHKMLSYFYFMFIILY